MKESFRRLCVASVWIAYTLAHFTELFYKRSLVEHYFANNTLFQVSVVFFIVTCVAGVLHLTINWIFQHKSSD